MSHDDSRLFQDYIDSINVKGFPVERGKERLIFKVPETENPMTYLFNMIITLTERVTQLEHQAENTRSIFRYILTGNQDGGRNVI